MRHGASPKRESSFLFARTHSTRSRNRKTLILSPRALFFWLIKHPVLIEKECFGNIWSEKESTRPQFPGFPEESSGSGSGFLYQKRERKGLGEKVTELGGVEVGTINHGDVLGYCSSRLCSWVIEKASAFFPPDRQRSSPHGNFLNAFSDCVSANGPKHRRVVEKM